MTDDPLALLHEFRAKIRAAEQRQAARGHHADSSDEVDIDLYVTGPNPNVNPKPNPNATHADADDDAYDPLLEELRLEERINQLRYVFQPDNLVADYCLEEYSRASLTAERLERDLEEMLRQKVERWGKHWDRERRIEAEKLAEQLRAAPARVVRELRRTPQGCDLLIERWQMLADVLYSFRVWIAEQVQLAFDLLGVPVELRRGSRLLGSDVVIDSSIPKYLGNRQTVPDRQTCWQLAETQIAQLQALRAELLEEDNTARAMAAQGLGLPETREEVKKQRLLQAALRRMKQYFHVLTRRKSGAECGLEPAGAPVSRSAAGSTGLVAGYLAARRAEAEAKAKAKAQASAPHPASPPRPASPPPAPPAPSAPSSAPAPSSPPSPPASSAPPGERP